MRSCIGVCIVIVLDRNDNEDRKAGNEKEMETLSLRPLRPITLVHLGRCRAVINASIPFIPMPPLGKQMYNCVTYQPQKFESKTEGENTGSGWIPNFALKSVLAENDGKAWVKPLYAFSKAMTRKPPTLSVRSSFAVEPAPNVADRTPTSPSFLMA